MKLEQLGDEVKLKKTRTFLEGKGKTQYIIQTRIKTLEILGLWGEGEQGRRVRRNAECPRSLIVKIKLTDYHSS